MLKLILWVIDWLRGKVGRAVQQQAADTTQQHHLEEQTHAVEQSQDHAPADVSAFADSVRRGDSL